MSRARTVVAASLGAVVVLTAAACAPQPQKSATSAASGAGSAACSINSPNLYKQGQLTVATDSPAYAPWFDNNTPADGKGFESAVAYAVAGKLGFSQSQVKWVVEPFDNSYAPGAKTFDFDINEISNTPERAKAVDFSTSYYTASQAVLVLGKSKYAGATSLSALKDAKIGVQVATTSYQAVIDEIKPTQQPSVFNTTNDEVNALQNGQIDAVVTDLPTVFYLAGSELQGGKILGQFGYAGGTPEQFGLLLGKGSGLTACVDQALAGLKADGTLDRLTSQWLASSANAPELKP
ncbi:polar amino acid transport system substrate-binding protein [Kitasatospora sp. MAP12-15]|uniref:ABC transporter substrate-binding protein n=1 Tax=unclassified Kitasatospora TaxID=2633591 RepID=UPI002475539D|nr:ABC transporter substrate-binding protein [Kitasatospora sp. MAP12-44]MDH6115253.1 polar amino acid transport system substrate-binding protein [Kitasatospora sp. MAP12-44]